MRYERTPEDAACDQRVINGREAMKNQVLAIIRGERDLSPVDGICGVDRLSTRHMLDYLEDDWLVAKGGLDETARIYALHVPLVQWRPSPQHKDRFLLGERMKEQNK